MGKVLCISTIWEAAPPITTYLSCVVEKLGKSVHQDGGRLFRATWQTRRLFGRRGVKLQLCRSFGAPSVVLKLASAAAVTTPISIAAAILIPSAAVSSGRSHGHEVLTLRPSMPSIAPPEDFGGGICPIPASALFIAHHARGRRHVFSG